MKKTIRSGALILLAALVFVSCIGCKGGSTQKDPSEVLSGELSLEMPKYDLGNNKVVKILSHDESVFASSKESFEKAYGATFEVQVVPFDNLKTTFVNGVMANDSTDLARSFTAAIANKGLLAPLDDHINFSTNLWTGILPTIDEWKYNGKRYVAFTAQQCTTCLWYNKEIFEEYGEKTPYEYLQEDNWNWNTMRDLAKKLTVDKDGDGSTDIYGLSLDQPWNLMFATGSLVVDYDENGKAKSALNSERVTRTMNFYQDLSIKDKVLGGGETKFIQGNVAMLQSAMWIAVKFPEQKEAGTFHMVPDPKDPEADKYYVPSSGYNWVIPSTAKNPKGAAALLCTERFLVAEKRNQEVTTGEIKKMEFLKDCEECNHVAAELRNNFDKYYMSSGKDWVVYDLLGINWDMWNGLGILDGVPWSQIAEQLNPIIEEAISKSEDQNKILE